MSATGKMSGGRWVDVETRREVVGCRCPSGHRFSAELLTAVSLSTDRAVLEELVDKGVQERECPTCHVQCRLAEPVGLHDPEGRRFALYVPESLSHRRIALLALTLEHIATLDPSATPEYYETPVLLCGRAELRRWLGGGSASLRTIGFGSQGAVRRSDSRIAQGTTRSEGEKSGAPEIHAAFADLVSEGSAPPSAAELRYLSEEALNHDEEGEDDWLSDELLDDRLNVEASEARSALVAQDRGDIEELDDGDVISEPVSLNSEEPRADQRIPSPVPTPGPTGIEDSSISLEQGKVFLSYRVDGTVLAKFASSRVELWFQLFEIGAFPLVTLTLVDDGRAAEPETLTWLLDLTRQEQRAIAVALQRRYQAKAQLYISSRYEPLLLDLTGHREGNVSVVLDRASTMLADHPPEDRPFDRAAERFARMPRPHGRQALPLEFHDRRPARRFEEANRFVRLLSDWFGDERYNYLIFVRSFPLDTFEELIRQGLEQAVAFGANVPEALIARTMTLGLASSRRELTSKLIDQFDATVRSGTEISDEEAVDNWIELLRRAHADKVGLTSALIGRIQQQVAIAGRTNDARLQEALSRVKPGV